MNKRKGKNVFKKINKRYKKSSGKNKNKIKKTQILVCDCWVFAQACTCPAVIEEENSKSRIPTGLKEMLVSYLGPPGLADIVYHYMGTYYMNFFKHFSCTFIIVLMINIFLTSSVCLFSPLLGYPFISTWYVSPGAMSIKLPLARDGMFDFMVEWGDGSPPAHITSFDQPEANHLYKWAGDYIIKLSGFIEGFTFKNESDTSRSQIADISQWGCVGLGISGEQFIGCSSLNVSALDVPDLTRVLSFKSMFARNKVFNGDVSKWSTGSVTDMSSMFANSSFNGDISNWNTANVTDMSGMFYNATAFTGDLSRWDVRKVTSMGYLFDGASSFDRDCVKGWKMDSLINGTNIF